jgi:alkanesulfonate monooxygenase
MKRKDLILGLFMLQGGHHEAGWRHPAADVDAGVNLLRYASYAKKAEAAAFHFLFVADSAGVREADLGAMSRTGRNDGFEPLTLLAALAALTSRIGLVATASTTFNEPYHVARKFASLDHLSGGRAGWNIVTSANPFEAQNFNRADLPAHDERYRRAEEFLEVTKGLWDTWADDAFVRDRASGLFFDPDKIQFLNHIGNHFKVRGPLNIARPLQGYPVFAQAGASAAGMEFAAQHGELIFTAQQTLAGARDFCGDIKRSARAAGRLESDVLILPGIVPVVAETSEAAHALLAELQDMIHPDIALELANRLLGYVADLGRFSVDDPVPDALSQTNHMQSRQRLLLDLARQKKFTIRQLAQLIAIGRGHLVLIGSADEVVDQMQEYIEAGAADGFIVMPPIFPLGLERFIQLVIPELRRRELFRSQYSGSSLRDNLGLRRPANPFFPTADSISPAAE